MRGAAVTIAFLAAIAVPARAAVAQTDAPAHSERVYDVSYPLDGSIIAVTTVGSLVPLALASHIIQPSCPCAPSSVNSFDRGVIGNASDTADIISTLTVGLALAGPPAVDLLAVPWPHPWLDDLMVFAEAISVNSALVTVAKYATQRPIPRVYSDPALAGDHGSYRSFYSGHVSYAFAALSTASVTLDARYGLTWQPWAATLAVGASVAVERVVAGYHFYTDVLVGAGAGLAVGTAVSLLHLHRGGVRLSIFRPTGDGMGISLAGAL